MRRIPNIKQPSVATQYQQPFGSQSSDQFSPPATGHGATAHGAMGQGAAGNGAIGHTSVLWVGGIPPGTPMQHLEFIFRRHNSMQIDLKPGKDQTQNWYAFIHFTKRSDAENARVALDGKQIFPGGAPLSVRWRQHGGPASHAGQPAIPLQVMPISTPTPVQPASTPSYGASMLQMPQAYPMQGHQAQTGTAPFNRPPMPHLSQPQNTQAHQAQASTSPVYGAPMPQLAQPQHMQMHHMQANQAQTGATMPQMMPQAHNMQAHQAQAGATSFHGAAIPQLPQVQPTPARQVPTGIAPYHGAAIPQLPQVQQTQPFRSSNTQGYPNQTGYMPHGTPFQQQGPATPHIAPSRPASQSQPLGAYRQGLQQSPMPAPPSNPYQPNLSSRNPSPASFAPSVAPSHVYHKAQTGDIGPYQTQSSHQGPVHGQTAPPVTIANLPPMTATQSTDSTRYHRHVGEHPAKNDQHHAQAKAKPQQQTQPGPALNRPSAPKPTQAHSASAAPSDKQSDKTGQGHGQGQGQGTKKPKLSRRQRKKRARENAAKQMTTTHTAARAVTEGTSNSTLGEPATTAEASTDTALAPKVAAEENHPPDVEPSDGESQPMQLESSGSDNNDDKDAAVVDETMHGVGKGKAADTLVDEGTRPNLPFRLGKSQQARTSLAHQAHYQVTPQVPPDVSGLEGTSDNNTTLDEDQVLGAAAPSSTAPQVPPQVPGLESTSDNNTTLDEDQVLGAAATSSTKAVSGTSSTRAVSNGDLELDSGSIETPLPSATNQPTDGAKGTVKDNKPSPGPASHQPGAKPTLHSQKVSFTSPTNLASISSSSATQT